MFEYIEKDGIEFVKTRSFNITLNDRQALKGYGTKHFHNIKDFLCSDSFIKEFNKKEISEFFDEALNSFMYIMLSSKIMISDDIDGVFAWERDSGTQEMCEHIVNVLNYYYNSTDKVKLNITEHIKKSPRTKSVHWSERMSMGSNRDGLG